MRIEPHEMQVAGDWVLARVEYIGKAEASGAEVTQSSWELSQWIDGQCRKYEVFWDRDQGEQAFARHAAE